VSLRMPARSRAASVSARQLDCERSSASVCFLAALVFAGFAVRALAAETPAFDVRSMIEVRTLSKLPKEVNAMLGREKSGSEGIADAGGRFNTTVSAGSSLPLRQFIVAGQNIDNVLVAYEQGGSSETFHASAFVYERSGWKQVREWDLTEKPDDLRTLLYLTFPDAEGVTEAYRKASRFRAIFKSRVGLPPSRRDSPLRDSNITDEEVREIQIVARQVMPGAIVNISGVVMGCPCEDGPTCSDQVWIVAYTPEKSRGLQLSKMGGHWTIGPLQQWWINYDELSARSERLRPDAFLTAESDLMEKYPACDKEKAQSPTAEAHDAAPPH
jgi:hypothetical protein